MEFNTLPEFERDFKQLHKKFRSLNEDLAEIRLILSKKPGVRPPFSFRIEGLGIETCIIKVRKIACKSLKGRGANSGLRLIYAYFVDEQRIVLIELYHKSDKPDEDRQRIMEHFGGKSR